MDSLLTLETINQSVSLDESKTCVNEKDFLRILKVTKKSGSLV
jgi:hypothetical protein